MARQRSRVQRPRSPEEPSRTRDRERPASEGTRKRPARPADLARSEESLRELNRRKDAFIAMLSHELRNPLAPIRTSLEVLRLAPPGSEAARDAIAIIDRASAHLARLVDDLLDATRITWEKIELKRAPVEVRALLQATLDEHRAVCEERRLTLELRCTVRELWVHADGERLIQIVSNVLGNAEKFTPAGGRIVLALEHVDNGVQISVEDTGIGIAPELIPQVFEPFAQGPRALDRGCGGLGLGLAAVKTLAERHGGSVAIRSPGLGRGTTVSVTLPGALAPHEVPVPSPPSRSPRRRILLVEDMRDTANALQQALRLRGHEVYVAYDGRSGLDLSASSRPDVVLCDLGLPDLDGFALARSLRATLGNAIYLVALSGYARSEDIARATAAGFDRHLAKPARLDEIDRVLAAIPATPNDKGSAG